MKISRTTAPTSEPVTLAEAKAHLRIEHDDENDYITTLIEVAREYVEIGMCNRTLMSSTWTLYLDEFPAGNMGICLPYPPVAAISSVTYYDTSGTQQTLSDYQLDSQSEPAALHPSVDSLWPSTQSNKYQAVTIVYTAGYADADSVPAKIKHAIKIILSELYENRENSIVGTNVTPAMLTAERLVSDLRVRAMA